MFLSFVHSSVYLRGRLRYLEGVDGNHSALESCTTPTQFSITITSSEYLPEAPAELHTKCILGAI